MSKENLKTGISAIIPTYKGEKHINTLLNSLKNQTINKDLFEIIFIVNGELDNTPNIIKDFQKENPEINIILTDSQPGVSNARNVGISVANREYTIFIDDDDYISPKYLETLFKYVKPGRIVLGRFKDINQDTGLAQESYVMPSNLTRNGIIDDAYSYMPDSLNITTNKLIPTVNVKNSKFNPELKSGVDTAYYSILYAENDFEFYLVTDDENAVYYRVIRENSVSRKPLSYDFNVTNRLKVINDINKGLKIAETQEKKSFLEFLTAGHVARINEYLKKYPDELKKVMADISSYNYDFFPYKYLNENLDELNNPNNELIISYAFPPTNTTTSNVVAKRILKNKDNVSVICASLNNLTKDYFLEKIVNEFVIDKTTINLPYESSLENIKEFVRLGLAELDKKPVYDKIYSRAHFIHSHLLGFFYKINNDTFWTAEFSDPLIYNFNGNFNSPPIGDDDIIKEINNNIPVEFEKIKPTDTLNYVIEYITYIFADEIIFTNENQKDVMINNFPNLKDIISKKAKISPHPTLNEKYYYIKNNDYPIDKKYINFAYFGTIFGSRNFEEFINGFDNLNEEFKDKYRLHLFSPNKIMFEQILSSDILSKTIINPSIDYLEFLNLTTKFDVLLVEDSIIDEVYSKNPFLPSKISDYKGSGVDIWAVCDKGSIMDGMNIKYKSYLKNPESSKNIINQIMSDKLNKDIVTTDFDLNNYLKQRNIHLTKKIEELILVAEDEFRKDAEYESTIKNLQAENSKLKKELDEGILKKLLKKIKN